MTNLFIMYSKEDCQWCDRARGLMDTYDLPRIEYKLGVDYLREDLQALLPEGTKITVPQIFVNDDRIGGYENFLEYLTNHGFIGGPQ